MPSPPTERAPVRERGEPRELAAFAALTESHPELAPALALERELLDGERRLLRRLGTPWLAVAADALAARLASGQRLIEWPELVLDWPEVRLRLRQVVDVLRRHDVVDAREAERLLALARDASLEDAFHRWYDAVVSPATIDTTLADTLQLTLRPFLSRTVEVVQQRVQTDVWQRGTCPMCGGAPTFGVLTAAAGRQLVCGRCHGRWVFDVRTCPHCLTASQLRTFAAQDGIYQVAACMACKRYIKALDARRAGRPLVLALDTVATLPLDQAIAEQGFAAE